jgi:hypothetical protein
VSVVVARSCIMHVQWAGCLSSVFSVRGEADLHKHANAWDFDHTVKLAFEEVGSGSNRHSTRETSHLNTALGVVAHTCDWSAQQLCDSFFSSIENGLRSVPFFVIERAWDATPSHMEFGTLQDHLEQSARYCSRDLIEDRSYFGGGPFFDLGFSRVSVNNN